MSLFSDIRGWPRYLDYVFWQADCGFTNRLIDGAVSPPGGTILPRAKKVVKS